MKIYIFLVCSIIFLGLTTPVLAQSCLPSVEVDWFSCKTQPLRDGSCDQNKDYITRQTESCNQSTCTTRNICSSNDSCYLLTPTLCGCTSSPAYCWSGGGPTPTPTPTPTPPAGCGTCNQFTDCSNTCSGTACGRCSNGGADCAWGSKSCGGGGTPTPTPTPATCTGPNSPTLSLPLNNANISGTTAALSWSESNWGNCIGPGRFWVFVGQCGNLPLLPTATTLPTSPSYSFAGISGQSYCWTVQAVKGIYGSYKAWPPRTFTLCSNSLPTNLALSSPTNGATAVDSPVLLSWSLTDWGNRCYATPNDQFKVYLGPSPLNPSPSPYITITNKDLRSTTYSSGTAGVKYDWKVSATNDGWVTNKETGISSFTLTAAPASSSWFQVVGGDVVAAGDITVSGGVPAGNKFLASPNAAMVYGGNTGIPTNQVDGWQVNADVASVVANSTYNKFKTRITNRVTPDPYSGDFTCTEKTVNGDTACYLYSPGTVTIDTAQTISQKIVLLADGNVNINKNISINTGGLLVILSGGNITLGGAVDTLQGVYLAQGAFNTGIYNTALTVNGTVVGLGNVNLQRTYNTNPIIPAEKFIFNPGYISILPTTLYEQHRQWQEFAP